MVGTEAALSLVVAKATDAKLREYGDGVRLNTRHAIERSQAAIAQVFLDRARHAMRQRSRVVIEPLKIAAKEKG